MREAPGISARGLVLRFALVVVAAFLVVPPGTTLAASPPPVGTSGHVRLLQPSTYDPRARRCLTRLREELEAGGFAVAVSEFGTSSEGWWIVDPPGPRDSSMATITLVGNPDEGAAELWIVNSVSWGRAAVRRLLVPAGSDTHDDEVVANRVLEFLRASTLELAATRPLRLATSPSMTPAATATATTTTATNLSGSGPMPAAQAGTPDVRVAGRASSAPRPLALELGVSVLESSTALGPAFLPVARFRAEWLSLLETRLTLAGFGTRARVSNPKGTAAVGHVLALLELRAAFRSGRAIRPAIGVGAGALRVSVDGTGTFPYEGTGGQRWAGLFDVGAGVTARLAGRLAIAFEVHGQLATPYPTIRFSGEEAARVARPALFSSLTLVTAL